uniref:Variant surface glycoprotein 1276 n=1 Tax=Trypanosoma brucei TaxID=5691 RepID=M4TB93_9TRYP|nr:variant surface glycoprotein 1276 [Trypanosoma brucei]
MYFLLALSLVFASSSVVHCNDGDPLLATAVNIVCKLTTGLKATPARFTAILSTTDTKITSIRRQELKGRLYKLLNNKTGPPEQLADIYARAAAKLRIKAEAARNRLAAASTKAAATGLAAGRMDEAIMLMFQAKGGSDRCLSQSSSSDQTATATDLPSSFPGSSKLADIATFEAEGKLATAITPQTLFTAIQKVETATVKDRNNKIGGVDPVPTHNKNCVITKGNGTTHHLVTSGSGTVKLGDGLWSVGGAATDHNIWPTTVISATHRPTLHTVIAEADYQAIVSAEAVITDSTGSKIAESEEFQQALSEATGGAKIGQPADKLKAMFKTDSVANFQKEFWNPFYTTQILSKSYGADLSKPENLGDKTDTTELEKAMDFYLTVALATIASKNKEISDIKRKPVLRQINQKTFVIKSQTQTQNHVTLQKIAILWRAMIREKSAP